MILSLSLLECLECQIPLSISDVSDQFLQPRFELPTKIFRRCFGSEARQTEICKINCIYLFASKLPNAICHFTAPFQEDPSILYRWYFSNLYCSEKLQRYNSSVSCLSLF